MSSAIPTRCLLAVVRFLVPLIPATACTVGSDPAALEREVREIVGGGLSLADPAVVALRAADGRPLCTGVVLSPAVVLTAAHCLQPGDAARRVFDVFAGAEVGGAGAAVRVGASHRSPLHDGFSRQADLALLRLADPLDLPALDIVRDPQADLGRLRLVGFGADEEGIKGVRRSGSAQPVRLVDDGLELVGGACFVDSGGPVLVRGPDDQERVGAVVSSGSWDCTAARATLTAHHQGWIDDQLRELDHPSCRADGTCVPECPFGDGDCSCVEDGRCQRCAGEDPDCAPTCGADEICAEACLAPDPDCGRLGEGDGCGQHGDCGTGRCTNGICRRPCDLGGGGDSCPPWLRCAPGDDTGADVCLPPHPEGRGAPGCQASPGRGRAPALDGDLLTLALLLWISRGLLALGVTERNRNQGKGTRT